jgi:predicted PurR-regulated permease PerM
MHTSPNKLNEQSENTIALGLRLTFVACLLVLSFMILKPFILPLAWATIIAVGINPFYMRLVGWFNGKKSLAATVIALIGLLVMVLPLYFIGTSVAVSLGGFIAKLTAGQFEIPPPTKQIADWPLVGEKLHEYWLLASNNLVAFIERIKPLILEVLPGVASSAADLVGAVLQFVLSIIIAVVMLANSDGAKKSVTRTFETIIGQNAADFVTLSQSTIKSVVNGVLGIAIVQTVFLALGMYVMGIPAAGVWTIAVLFLAITQLPPTIIMLPIIIYAFGHFDTLPAVIFCIWSIAGCLLDSVLKPVFLGRGVEVPMLVILMGAIGGMIAFGIIGLFVGAVVLAISYKVASTLATRASAD